MIDFNIFNAILVATFIVIFIRFVLPYFKKTKRTYYDEVKLGLMLFGYAFRNDKIKAIANTALTVVREIESLHLSPEEKHALAAEKTFRELLNEFNIELDEEVIDLIIQIAVSLLPKTNNTRPGT